MGEATFAHLFVGEPTLAKIEQLVRCCEQRKSRASQKLAAAQAEIAAAEAAYDRAIAARATWIETGPGPDPQLMMM
ncbi:hypothetical protein WSK_4036 [Novosphingobium sp. Rr 2-17]|uniref:hypothetical protein n=1 Tax=Novosphingobium sp. Rr 2-17 TaxID=555793 RepID=UPI0002699C0F|nr:hypothetical protein [Novosphingobium sp. Rr 2-17]EIZ77422.1 hypothetical protein WSK_4036 [Novosphingobium sp. Rr 2-17]